MSGLLANKVAAITGGSSGIGRAIALEFAKNGAKVVINYYPNEQETSRAISLGNEIKQLFPNTTEPVYSSVPGDIGDPATGKALVAKAVDEFGKLDVFVSNAGICPFHEFTTMPEEVYYRTVKTNLDGAFFSTQAAANQMKLQGTGGSIIGISSISALVGGEFQTHYTTTKAGVLSLMQSTAVALGKYNIRCNALLPGTIETDINKDDLKDQSKRDYFNKRIPLGRLGEPSDLAGPAVFLASDLSKYVTGSQILVDGGLFVNLQ
ncbi:Sps19p [Sugiyamaella lignohabitans]|uniref:Sps19p n=1 Tax=Sugiyamaella lignohabitans TaxID=796027 RepID=A0A167EF46_9ASCO|nr:Sps19p [Sugiyamaella lignohabitans]ANB13998.1 Sps19p [Sugiyamaella lignohabitans]